MKKLIQDRFGRDTSHLRDSTGIKSPEFATQCIAAVEGLFGRSWLDGNEGQLGHRLQTLWRRKDWLATNELFGLGRTILELEKTHQQWLDSTAKKIKSGVENAHGFITEILTCGSIKANAGKVSPAPGNQKGYDFTVDFPSGFKYFISIKSQTMAQHETEFHRLGDQLKSAFSERLNSLGKRGRLILYSDLYIPSSTFEFLIDFVRNKLTRYDTYTYRGCSLRFTELERSKETYASSIQSHFVLIYCPQHFNALKNAKSKLVDAGKNMLAQLPCSDNYFRYLWVRVHSSTEIAILKEACDLMLKDHGHDYGFDAVIFLQPSVARDGSGSVINTYVTMAIAELHQGFNRAIMEGRAGQLIIDTPVGTLSDKPSELYLFNENGRMKMPEGNYVYQKADLYYLLRKEGDEFVGDFYSPASGVRHHLVYKDASGEVLFDAQFVEVDETLII